MCHPSKNLIACVARTAIVSYGPAAASARKGTQAKLKRWRFHSKPLRLVGTTQRPGAGIHGGGIQIDLCLELVDFKHSGAPHVFRGFQFVPNGNIPAADLARQLLWP